MSARAPPAEPQHGTAKDRLIVIDVLLLAMQLLFCNAASRERIVVMTCVVEIRRVAGRPNRLFACHGQCAWQDLQSDMTMLVIAWEMV